MLRYLRLFYLTIQHHVMDLLAEYDIYFYVDCESGEYERELSPDNRWFGIEPSEMKFRWPLPCDDILPEIFKLRLLCSSPLAIPAP